MWTRGPIGLSEVSRSIRRCRTSGERQWDEQSCMLVLSIDAKLLHSRHCSFMWSVSGLEGVKRGQIGSFPAR